MKFCEFLPENLKGSGFGEGIRGISEPQEIELSQMNVGSAIWPDTCNN